MYNSGTKVLKLFICVLFHFTLHFPPYVFLFFYAENVRINLIFGSLYFSVPSYVSDQGEE